MFPVVMMVGTGRDLEGCRREQRCGKLCTGSTEFEACMSIVSHFLAAQNSFAGSSGFSVWCESAPLPGFVGPGVEAV